MPRSKHLIDSVAIPLALVLILFWAVVAFGLGGPGWIHVFLTAGVFLLIYGIVVRGGRAPADRR